MSKKAKTKAVLYLAHPDPYGKSVGLRPTQKMWYKRQNEILDMSYASLFFMAQLPKRAQENVKFIVHPTEFDFKWGDTDGVYVEVGAVNSREFSGIGCDMDTFEKSGPRIGWEKFSVFDPLPQDLLDMIEEACDYMDSKNAS